MRRTSLGRFWALVAIGGATAVGITTQRPGFVVITLLGGLVLPRLLGVGGPGSWHAHGCVGDRNARIHRALGSWHREAHGETSAPAPGGEGATA
jgi:hypothetical protein